MKRFNFNRVLIQFSLIYSNLVQFSSNFFHFNHHKECHTRFRLAFIQNLLSKVIPFGGDWRRETIWLPKQSVLAAICSEMSPFIRWSASQSHCSLGPISSPSWPTQFNSLINRVTFRCGSRPCSCCKSFPLLCSSKRAVNSYSGRTTIQTMIWFCRKRKCRDFDWFTTTVKRRCTLFWVNSYSQVSYWFWSSWIDWCLILFTVSVIDSF